MTFLLFWVTQLLVFTLLVIAAVFAVLLAIFSWMAIAVIDSIEGLLHGKN